MSWQCLPQSHADQNTEGCRGAALQIKLFRKGKAPKDIKLPLKGQTPVTLITLPSRCARASEQTPCLAAATVQYKGGTSGGHGCPSVAALRMPPSCVPLQSGRGVTHDSVSLTDLRSNDHRWVS